MRKDDAVRLRHMLDAAREAMSFVRGRSRADLDTDRQLVLVLVIRLPIDIEQRLQALAAVQTRLIPVPPAASRAAQCEA